MAQYQVREQFTVGETAQMRKTVTEADVMALAEVTGDYNPLHTDDDFAARTRFQGRIVHGVLAAGLISAALGMKLPGPGAIYLSQTLNFVHPVRVGDTLTAEVEITRWRPEKRIVNLKTRCFNQEGRDVLEGEAVLLMETLAEPA